MQLSKFTSFIVRKDGKPNDVIPRAIEETVFFESAFCDKAYMFNNRHGGEVTIQYIAVDFVHSESVKQETQSPDSCFNSVTVFPKCCIGIKVDEGVSVNPVNVEDVYQSHRCLVAKRIFLYDKIHLVSCAHNPFELSGEFFLVYFRAFC